MIAEELRRFGVPHFMVRSKIDADVANNEEDHGIPAAQTLASIQADMQRQGVVRPYLLSGKFPQRASFDMDRLIGDALEAICDARDVPSDWLRAPPPAAELAGAGPLKRAQADPACGAGAAPGQGFAGW